MSRLVGIIATLLIHLLVVLLFLLHPRVYPAPPKKDSGNIGKMQQAVSVKLIPLDQLHSDRTSNNQQGPTDVRSDHICMGKDDTYVGIGVTYSTATYLIISAPESYPAYKAGIRVGDMFIDPDIKPAADGYATINIMRDKVQLKFRVKFSSICFLSQ